MESVLNILTNAENVRMLAIIAIVWSAYVRLSSKMDRRENSLEKKIYGVESSLNKRIDGVEASIKELSVAMNGRIDDLTSTIEALTYALEKNGTLQKEDKDYVDSRLAH